MEIENQEDNPAAVVDSGGDFDCNICLDQVRDPVVTFCGHLFCWPCIYKWTYSSSTSRQRVDQNHKKESPKCPVCKTDVSDATLVPIYGRGQKTSRSDLTLPSRPSGPVYNVRGVGQGESQRYMFRMPDSVMGAVCETVYRRLFGASSSNVIPYRRDRDSNIRLRRRTMQAEESLSRIYLFMLCFMVMCLLHLEIVAMR
ncbi:E3 ubiquitin-protein ligase RMA2 [Hirschfeldia incana]|nr:E3 ubiquitin-protein ligase RMA2 [Hirschfeldia incana]KAJ0250926.1 E3 ubiquitin-protein ligase RMA2 [Hirschfeldia incana]KAJ0250927.1 E3 ubiquitin-protein ligase RMA2 [Hirschfeldia incana]